MRDESEIRAFFKEALDAFPEQNTRFEDEGPVTAADALHATVQLAKITMVGWCLGMEPEDISATIWAKGRDYIESVILARKQMEGL